MTKLEFNKIIAGVQKSKLWSLFTLGFSSLQWKPLWKKTHIPSKMGYFQSFIKYWHSYGNSGLLNFITTTNPTFVCWCNFNADIRWIRELDGSYQHLPFVYFVIIQVLLAHCSDISYEICQLMRALREWIPLKIQCV